jgi:hypothetical protein
VFEGVGDSRVPLMREGTQAPPQRGAIAGCARGCNEDQTRIKSVCASSQHIVIYARPEHGEAEGAAGGGVCQGLSRGAVPLAAGQQGCAPASTAASASAPRSVAEASVSRGSWL